MTPSGKFYLALGIVGVAGLGTAVVLSRRRRSGFRGMWSEDTTKLASIADDEVTVIWKLPPGPSPKDARSTYADLCSRGGGPHRWMRPMHLTTHKPPDPWREPENQPLPWWTAGGTCPGCSRICGVACYAARAQNYYDFAVRRVPWSNLCDLMSGKGLPKIVEKELPGRQRYTVSERTPGVFRPETGPGATETSGVVDYWSKDLVVDPRKVRRVMVRVHETGDFFDPKYAEQWLTYARRYVDRYNREMQEYQSGSRQAPPPRVYFWAYTRSWRDPRFRPVLRQFSKIRYPEEIVDGKRLQAGDAFSVLLSADADTGVPWAKDARGRIMPVAYLLTKHDFALASPINNRVPGVIFQDYNLRKETLPTGEQFGTKVCRAEFMTPAQEELVAKLEKKAGRSLKAEELKKLGLRKVGCGTCHMCQPNAVQAIADNAWSRFLRAARAGIDGPQLAVNDLALRSDDTTDYERFSRRKRTGCRLCRP